MTTAIQEEIFSEMGVGQSFLVHCCFVNFVYNSFVIFLETMNNFFFFTMSVGLILSHLNMTTAYLVEVQYSFVVRKS